MTQRDNAALQRLAGELLETLQPARQALETPTGEPPTLTGCAESFHLAACALHAGDLHALALLAEQAGELAQASVEGRIANRGEAAALLARVVRDLPPCLGSLALDDTGCPPMLLQHLDDLRALRGEPSLAQGELFTPTMPGPAPVLDAEALAGRATAELPLLLRKLRQAQQMALLEMLRNPGPPASRTQLRRVFARLHSLCRETPQAALWRGAAVLGEGLEDDSLVDGPAVRRLLRQLDRQLRQLLEDGADGFNQPPAEALLRGLLFQLALLPAGSPRREALKVRYQLAQALPSLARLDQFVAAAPSASAPAFDPQLLQIFRREADAHLCTLRAFIQQSSATLPQLPSDDLQRALHTLRGAALMAGVLPVAEIVTPLEALVRDCHARQIALEEPHHRLLQTGEQLLRRAVQNIPEAQLAAIEGAPAYIREVQAAHRLVLERDETARCACNSAASSINPLELIDDAWLVDSGVSAPRSVMPASETCDSEMLQVFADEASELLAAMQATLAAVPPADEAPTPELLRILHTLKGAARLAGETRMADLAHELEQPLAEAGQVSLAQLQGGQQRLRAELDALCARLAQQADGESLCLPQSLLRVPDELLQRLSRLTARASSLRQRITRLDTHNAPLESLVEQQKHLDDEIERTLQHARGVRLEQLLPRLRRLVRQLAGQLGKQVELRCDDSLGEIDRGLLASLVMPLEHLLRNAVDHGIETPEQRRAAGKPPVGALSLQLSGDGEAILLVLGDDGAGVDIAAVRERALARGLLAADAQLSEADALQLIRRPGFSAAAELTQISGRGIGLDAVDAAIRQLGGSLQIESTAGQGSRWLIRLPLGASTQQPQAGDAQLPLVMLVDDSPTARQLLARLLERNGMRVELHADGAQALQRLREVRPALLVLDRHLPGADGLEVARQVRDEAHLQGLPILMVSADEAPLDAAQAAAVNLCLAKPYQDVQLLACVRQLLAAA
jgi:chemotaxis protein histidine kinase CheA